MSCRGEIRGSFIQTFRKKDLTEAGKGDIIPFVVVRKTVAYGPLAQLVRASGS